MGYIPPLEPSSLKDTMKQLSKLRSNPVQTMAKVGVCPEKVWSPHGFEAPQCWDWGFGFRVGSLGFRL